MPPYAQSACGLTATTVGNGFRVSVSSKTGIVFAVARSGSGAVTRTCDVTAAIGGNGGCADVVAAVGTW